MIDTIIFDLEGVIINSEIIWDKGQEEFLKRRNIDYDRNQTKHLFTGKSLLDGTELMIEIYNLQGNLHELAAERREIVKEYFANELMFIPGFESFYEMIKIKYKTCIATSLEKKLLEIADQRMGLSRLFDGKVFSIENVGCPSKPNPDIFLYAANNLGSHPQSCLVLEDSPHGIEAAKRAGMKCFALTTTYTIDRLREADSIVTSYSEIVY